MNGSSGLLVLGVRRSNPHLLWRGCAPRIALILIVGPAISAVAQSTGTFIDRLRPTDLRVVSYNVYFDSVFDDVDLVQADKFARVMNALEPDVLNLQEIYDHSAADVVALMNSVLPLPDDATWFAVKGYDNILVSKYPLSFTRTTTIPNPASTNYAIGLVDLPDEHYATDFYFMNAHFKCCGGFDPQRQVQADALVNWMRMARSPGGPILLPEGTPMAVVGDLNIVDSPRPLQTLISGDVYYESAYGPDSPPDWDGTSLADAHPLHNGGGPSDYTWRSDNSGFAPGRLDYVLYTDSVVGVSHSFVLNTVAMSSAERASAGLERYDVTLSTSDYDHLPLVVDFRFPSRPGDFNGDNKVDTLDYEAWRVAFGTTSTEADGNGDGAVDAADYVIWRQNVDEPPIFGVAPARTPEPASHLLCLCWGAGLAAIRRRLATQHCHSNGLTR
jgi:endonuclease/exonuclease/phosphatase family metal-dependent hydrolase